MSVDRDKLAVMYRELSVELHDLESRKNDLTWQRQDVVMQLLNSGLGVLEVAELVRARPERITTIRDRAVARRESRSE